MSTPKNVKNIFGIFPTISGVVKMHIKRPGKLQLFCVSVKEPSILTQQIFKLLAHNHASHNWRDWLGICRDNWCEKECLASFSGSINQKKRNKNEATTSLGMSELGKNVCKISAHRLNRRQAFNLWDLF